ncbi:RelE protein [Salmonella enterica subsp. enterica]|uniref:RelE protein n=1 Tax=Salmonella enterica I TaxID=59201 RepID=A0A379WAD7_SALET|nr:RelE protein [Salmonella enterica subsp. enterica]
MTYKLAFNESALKEWKKLGHTIQEQFKKKLRERLKTPRVPASQLHGRKDQYKIKLRGAGYRLVYSVEDEIITVTVIGVGKRENDAIYKVTRQQKLITQKMLSFPSSDTTNRLSSFM